MVAQAPTKPCIQCGECCKEWVCPLGMELLSSQEPPCMALEYHNNKYWCGLALNPESYNPAIASMTNSEIEQYKEKVKQLVGIGLGSDGCLRNSE